MRTFLKRNFYKFIEVYQCLCLLMKSEAFRPCIVLRK